MSGWLIVAWLVVLFCWFGLLGGWVAINFEFPNCKALDYYKRWLFL
jgi:hypothetical protein